MYILFFHEFRVIPPANGFQLVCYTAILFTTEGVDRGLTLIGVSLTSAAWEEQGTFHLVSFSEGSLKDQAAWAEAAELLATANSSAG